MKSKIIVVVLVFVFGQLSVFGQSAEKSKDGFYYDNLVIMDYTTNESSERMSRTRKPMNRKFFLKSDKGSYQLFTGNTANYNTDEVLAMLDNGFSLYLDKMEYQDHKNLKPSIMEIMDENNQVIETVEDLGNVSASALKRKIKKDAMLRFSGFIVSVNEEKLGPIYIDIEVVE